MTEPAIEASSSQTQSTAATPEIVPKVDTTTTTSAAGMTSSRVPEVLPTGNAASAGGGAATTGDSDGNKLEVVMGHPDLWAPMHVSRSEVMSTTHFLLCQAHDVLQQDRVDIEGELQRLSEWRFLLKEWTTFEKQKAMAKRERLDEMELLLNQEWVSIGLLKAKAHKLMVGAKELYADVEACVDATIK
jgi:hypothetical protein